ncbi:MAG TPA: alkaline phosphatase family protein [Lacunisphaera sp.]
MNASFRLVLIGLFVAPLAAHEKSSPPPLAVVVVVDQMRADYLVRFRPYFCADGFNRLLEGGADYQNCHYQHAITKTAPGHATVLSGVNANVHGIIANEWLDRTTFLQGNAVEDTDAPLVGLPPRMNRYASATLAAKAGRSPRNYLGTTVGDALKARYGAAAQVYGVADKDRSAILPAGRRADGAYWTEEGRFVTSSYYQRELPAWVEDFNTRHNAAQYFGQTWDRLREKSIYDAVQGPDDAPGEQPEDGLPVTFPKRVDGGQAVVSTLFYSAFDHTPWNNEVLEEMAEHTIITKRLGQDEVPDLITIGFSQTDRAGHAYGPDSHEVMDSYLRLDLTLARLLKFLDEKVGRGRWVLALTADHGVSPLPEKIQSEKGADAAGRFSGSEFDARVTAALDQAFGPLGDGLYWAVRDGGIGYHLNPAAWKEKALTAVQVEAVVKTALLAHPVIAAVYTRTELESAQPLDNFGEMTRLSYLPSRSPDVMFICRPYFMGRALGVEHGAPYEYDTHVPQVWFGAGVKHGAHTERVAVEDLAPTLAGLLGVELPPEAKGRRLF